MKMAEDHPINTFEEETIAEKQPGTIESLTAGAKIGAFVTPLVCVEITPPEASMDYLVHALLPEAAAGAILGLTFMGIVIGVQKAANFIKNRG